MLTRVGDFAQHQRMAQLLLDAQTRAREAQVQIGTGQVAQRFREVAPDAERLLATKDALYQIRQYRANNELAAKRLEVMESSVGSLHEVGTRLKVLLLQRLDAGSAVPGVITPELQHLLEQAVSDLNVDFNGRFLFSGTRTDTAPVALDPAFAGFGGPDDTYYRGDGVSLSVRADANREVAYGMTADRPGFQELIGALRAALEGDASDDRALLESALGLVNAALPKVGDYRSGLGAGQAALERINVGHDDAEVYLERRISDIENVDLTEAITRMTQDQMVIESAMATIARLSQVTLADFLR
jgi:flagellar hook-associated protein 3 FlgL